MYRRFFTQASILVLSIAWIFTGAAGAQLRPSSAVLLPYFEVDMGSSGKTTFVAVGNVLNEPVDIQIEMRTNWGIPIFNLPVKLQPHEVRSFNLRDWIVQGNAPGRSLKANEKAHTKAALTGEKSPKDNLFYSTAVAPDLAVGSIVIRTQPNEPPGALWGDFLLVDPALDISMGDDLINLDRSAGCQGTPLCDRHALRFVSGKSLNLDTQVLIWTDRSVQPSKTPFPASQKVDVDGTVYTEAGTVMSEIHLQLLPLQIVSINSLGLKEPFGWIDLESEQPVFIGLHFDSLRSDGAALQAYCLPPDNVPPPPDLPRIELEKRTNGHDADTAPGPSIPVGAPVLWEYIVRNTGNSRLTQILVEDDQGVQVTCPKDALNPGESMTCTGNGTAVACQYENLGTVTAKTPAGDEVTDEDPSHYFGSQNVKIDIETAVNGNDADTAPGLMMMKGSPVQWTYVVTNTGDLNLAEISVSDEKGLVLSCPKTSLRPGESMTCTASGTSAAGQYSSVGTVTAKPPCGPDVSDNDPVHYFGKDPGDPRLKIQKLTNGQHYTQAPGASVAVGSTVTWSYIVTNNGQVPLTNVQVTDDKVSPISCPKTSLEPGESMTCTASGKATACQYSNTATAVGTPPNGPNLTSQDWSFYFGQVHPAIDIEKRTNGQDAPVAPGPMINVGSPVLWTYIVKNTGDVVLTNVTVTDDKGVAVSCPKTTLQPGESMTCTGNGLAILGQYRNVGTATGRPPCGEAVSDNDPSHYFGKDPEHPGIKVEKLTNGQHYNQAPGANVAVGSTVTWSYIVMNTGNVTLTNVRVTDNKVGSISCPKTTLQPGESMTCTASGQAAACQYSNTGTAVGTPPSGPNVSDEDLSFYFGQLHPAIDIEKRTNGQDVTAAPGPSIPVGSPVQWTYIVKNTGDVALTNVKVTDDKGVAVSCPKTTLQPGESMTCTGSGTATAGQYTNVGTATGTPAAACGDAVSDSDASYYFGMTTGNQGCTPGYWKNHTDSWPPTGYSTSQQVDSVFAQSSSYPALGNSSLLAALSFMGGSTLEGAAEILLRASTAALLNSAHPGVNYPRSTASVISDVDAALASGDRDTMIALASDLDADNNLGCPLN